MSKKKVLLEIKEFREAFNKIEPTKFYFNQFVREYNDVKKCGTICCLWGWIPQIAPEIADRYKLYYNPNRIIYMSESPHILHWPVRLRTYLFFPNKVLSLFNELNGDSSLSEVLKAWDDVIDTLENTKKLDHLF